MALAGVILQFLEPAGWKGAATLLLSFALLLIFAAENIRTAGFVLIAAGLSLNALVIAANAGMPVTREAIVRSGQASTIPELEAGAGGSKHHLAERRHAPDGAGRRHRHPGTRLAGRERRRPRAARGDHLVHRLGDAAAGLDLSSRREPGMPERKRERDHGSRSPRQGRTLAGSRQQTFLH